MNPPPARPQKNIGAATTAADKLNAKGLAAARDKDFAKAAYWFERAVAASNHHWRHATNLGNAYKALGRHEDAVRLHRSVIAAHPDIAGPYNNLGNALVLQGKFSEAIDAFQTALRLDPGLLEAKRNLALALQPLGRIPEAITLLKDAISCHPQDHAAWRSLMTASLYTPDMRADQRFHWHRQWNAQFPAQPQPSWLNRPLGDPPRKLRIGVLSSDLYSHPVGRNYLPIFSKINPQSFEVIYYSLSNMQDGLTRGFQASPATIGWRSAAGLSDAAIAAMMRDDAIDITFFIAAHFDDNRPLAAQHHPSPLVVIAGDSGLGLDGVDYHLSDRVLSPRPTLEPSVERVLRPPSFYVHDPILDAPEIDGAPASKRFIAAHNPRKINPMILGLWGDCLRAVPDATLTLRYRNDFLDPNQQQRVRKDCGADVADRIIFDGARASMRDHLANISQARVGLDSFPFHGASVTFETLWMGVPVVSLLGDGYFSRFSASMLLKAGLSQCIARRPEEYVSIAAHLINATEELDVIRGQLRRNLLASSLCDGAKTARWFERLFKAIWRRYEKSAPPRQSA